MGAHEAQARRWDTRGGHRRRFWELHYPELRATFPEALGDVGMEEFHRAFNAVRPGLVRVQADELTYDFHVMLRVEIERALVDGSLKVADLPEAWGAAMLRDLGLRVPDDRLGVLQDIHWSVGYIGSFCSYTIGNVMAAQLYDAAVAGDAAVATGLQAGHYAPLREWLTTAIHQHGRRFSRDELLVRATGKTLDPSHYLAALDRSYV